MTQTFSHPFALSVDRSRLDDFKQLIVKSTTDQSINNKIPNDQSTINQSINPAKLSPFTQSAILLRQGIKQIDQLINSQKKAYMDIHRHLSNHRPTNQSMTDDERDALESMVGSFVLEYKAKIEDLASTIQDQSINRRTNDRFFDDSDDEAEQSINQSIDQPVSKDLLEHQHAICQSLLNQLKSITQSIHQLKQFRIDQFKQDFAANKNRFEAKYSAPKRSINQSTNQSVDHSRNSSTSQSTSQSNFGSSTSSIDQSTRQSLDFAQSADNESMNQSMSQSIDVSDPVQAQLLQENAALLQSLESDVDAIQQAESKAHDIAQLIDLFHTKVLEQAETIDRIDQSTIESTSMIENGIEQLRRAAHRGSNFRMMILFVIVVLSLSLLFLDWYSS